MKKWQVAFISILSVLVLVFFDQYTKYLTLEHIAGKSPIYLIPDVLSFTFVKNQGGAFGLMQGQFILFYVMMGILLLYILYAFVRTPLTKRYIPIFVIMIMLVSGAIGNTYDRIFRGYVVDMISFDLIHFPVFNMADCYVTVSCFLLIFLLLFYYKDEDLDIYSWKRKKKEDPASNPTKEQ